MPPDLELCLEAGVGGVIPPDCYAAVQAGQNVLASLTRCTPYTANPLVGTWSAGAGPVVVDIFQKVGSITMSVVEPGSLTEGAVEWPGMGLLQLRVFAVESTSAATPKTMEGGHGTLATEVTLGLPPPLPGTSADVADITKFTVQAAADRLLPEPTKVYASPGLIDQRTPPPCSPVVPPRSPELQKEMQDEQALAEKAKKLYKPISLNNCDQIIPNLYLGGVTAAEDTNALKEQGIRAVCCCCRELEYPTDDFSKDLEYYRVDVEDMSREPISLFFPEATEFIHSWISNEQPVLVHCRAGTSRSPSVVIAYLMAYHGYSLHDAFYLVRSHRPCVTPNVGFIEQLGEYEEEKRNTDPTIDVNKYIAWYENPVRAAVPDLKPD